MPDLRDLQSLYIIFTGCDLQNLALVHNASISAESNLDMYIVVCPGYETFRVQLQPVTVHRSTRTPGC